MDRVNHLWPDIGALVPQNAPAQCLLAWLFASGVTEASLNGWPLAGLRKRKSEWVRMPGFRSKKVREPARATCLAAHRCIPDACTEANQALLRAVPFGQHVLSPANRVATLRWAARRGFVSVLRALKSCGLITLKDIRADQHCVLAIASKHGHVHVLQYFKDWRDTMMSPLPQFEGTTPALQRAAKVGDVGVARLLNLWGNMNLDGTCQPLTLSDVRAYNNKVVHKAAKGGHVAIFEFLKEWGLTREHLRQDDFKVLRLAAKHGHVAVFKFLKDRLKLTQTDVRIFNNWTLGVALAHGHVDVLRFLKDEYHLTMDDVRSCSPNMALDLAVSRGHGHAIQFLREWGLRVKDVRRDVTVMWRAAERDHVHILQMFKSWQDVGPDGSVSRFTLKDVRRHNNLALTLAARNRCMSTLQFFKEWRDPDGSALTAEDILIHETFLPKVQTFMDEWLDGLTLHGSSNGAQ